jgi:hypothetical protein
VSNQAVFFVLGITLLAGVAVGYGVREFISYRRRTAARRKATKRRREEAKRLGFKEWRGGDAMAYVATDPAGRARAPGMPGGLCWGAAPGGSLVALDPDLNGQFHWQGTAPG